MLSICQGCVYNLFLLNDQKKIRYCSFKIHSIFSTHHTFFLLCHCVPTSQQQLCNSRWVQLYHEKIWIPAKPMDLSLKGTYLNLYIFSNAKDLQGQEFKERQLVRDTHNTQQKARKRDFPLSSLFPLVLFPINDTLYPPANRACKSGLWAIWGHALAVWCICGWSHH